MNRRTLLGTALAAAVTTPALADARGTVTRITTSQNASWSPAARAHEHRDIATAYMAKLIADRHLIAQSETWPIDVRVDFTRLSFSVDIGRVWDSERGFRSEKTGPVVSIFERGIKVGEGVIYAYSGSLSDVPAVSMVTPSLDYPTLKNAIPGQIKHDNSRFFNALRAQRARQIEIA